MSLWSILVVPFAEYAFMRTALVACIALAVASGPLGTLLLLRRMGLFGNVLSHAVMPGAAIGFALAGSALAVLSIGGLITGLAMVLFMMIGTRFGEQREDVSLAAFYTASIGVGVLVVSLRGTNVDLMHVLLGTVLAIDVPALVLIVTIASIVVASLAFIFRPLAIQSFDPAFLRATGGSDIAYRAIFLVLIVLDLVAGFQALGTLLAGVPLLLPPAAARCWARRIGPLVGLSIGFGIVAGYAGLLASYHLNVPSGPAIACAAALIYAASTLVPASRILMTALKATRPI
ncbi:metal ABC transporter permease [Reyranella soli]|uniref:Zinc ABC transporter permease n=1 Tax=Reyranella soli TaxID=1230389 RepID=A0A512NND2_9HYPH|nr:metal ABC transporter permease [Reyranella soli]GEP60455.1 zinc ABC transporter permease [Reyranella soli]